MTSYSDIIIDHFENPRNMGVLPEPNAQVRVGDPVCGDTVELSVLYQEGRVKAVRFQAYGCAPALALGSVLTQFLEGADAGQVAGVDEERVAQLLGGLSPNQRHVSSLGLRVLKALHSELTRTQRP